jgi:hypothetical protein
MKSNKLPTVKLVGTDGNVFNIMSKTRKALKDAGLKDEAEAFVKRAMACQSYDEVLRLVMTYCDIT